MGLENLRRWCLASTSAAILVGCAAPSDAPDVSLRILSFNDFHGNIQSADPGPGRMPLNVNGAVEMVEAGGAAYLASVIAREKQGHPNNIVVSAGDLTGASPLVSALLRDEPTIRIMNRIGLDINAVGNHEFDYGRAELQRKAAGGCLAPEDCQQGQFRGAAFQYLAANVVDAATGTPLFDPYVIREFDGIPVGFIGVVTAETPTIVAADGIKGLRFLGITETLNRYAADLREDGVRAIVAVLHEGASVPMDAAMDGTPCHDLNGALTDIVAAADPEIDLFITGHTHQAYACRLDGRLVTQTVSYGRMLSVTDFTLSRESGDVVAVQVQNVPVLRDLMPDAAIEAEIAAAEAATAPIRAQPVTTLRKQLTRAPNDIGESLLGDVIADGQLASARLLGAQIAFMNPGGIRQDLPSDVASGLDVTLGDLFAVQPFGNNLVAMDLRGAELKLLLEQQWLDQPADRKPRMLQISDGFTYCYDDSRADGDKIVATSMKLGGVGIDPAASYRIVVNSFLADGGDKFAVLKTGRNRVQGSGDLDAFREHLAENAATLATMPGGRICRAS